MHDENIGYELVPGRGISQEERHQAPTPQALEELQGNQDQHAGA
jgi:hypothetical protein